MIDFFTASQNIIFTATFLFLILIAMIQVVGIILGVGLFDSVENVFPDIDFEVSDIGDAVDVTFFQGFLTWLNLGKVPLLISFSLMLFLFSLVGFSLQSISQSMGLGFLPVMITVPFTLMVCIPAFRIGNVFLAKIIPKDETAAISRKTFIGRIATIVLGEANFKKSAEAKLEDQYGKTHYVMVVADNKGDSFFKDQQVLVVGMRGSNFTVISNPNPNLGD